VVLNLGEMPTGEIVRQRDASLRIPEREAAVAAAVGAANLAAIDANRAAERLMGDSVFANMLMLGFAWQRGLVPIGFDALARAIELNGVSIDKNHTAFAVGRVLAAAADRLAAALGPETPPAPGLDALIDRRAAFLADYQDAAYAARYRARLAAFRAALPADAAEGLAETAARSLFKLMAYKDEYEVARLHADPGFAAGLGETFEDGFTLKYHLAPPLLPLGLDARGRPRKRRFGPWMGGAFRLLARMRRVRGTWADPFGHTAERRMERELIGWYGALMDRCAAEVSPESRQLWARILAAPMEMRGFGPVKAAAVARVRGEVAEALAGTGPR
jgi:indolepyruvate ferredoxin oxidoreductase